MSLKGSLKEEAPNCIPLIAGGEPQNLSLIQNLIQNWMQVDTNIFVIFHVDAVYCLGQPAVILHWSILLLIYILTL